MNDSIKLQNECTTLQKQLEQLRRDQTCDGVASAFKYSFKYGGMATIMCCGYLILAFADRSQFADIMLRYITTMPSGQIAAYTAGLIGVLFGFQQWRLLKKYELKNRARIAELETHIAANPSMIQPEEVHHA